MNRIVVFMQIWNEEHWFPYSYNSIYDFADEIVILEGCHTPWNQNSSLHSTDKTTDILKDLLVKDTQKKTNATVLNGISQDTHKLRVETIVKNMMLMRTSIQTGDWIFIVDADEVYKKSDLKRLKKFLKTTKADDLEMTEYQFVYNFNTYLDASHHRLFRYFPGSCFAAVNNLAYAHGVNYRDNSEVIPKEICKIYHYPYMKTPQEIWTKINSFNRNATLYPDRLKWFKEIYVPFTFKEKEKYYKKVEQITGSYGFAWEGGSILKEFTGIHPEAMKKHPYKNIDWSKEVKNMKFMESEK